MNYRVISCEKTKDKIIEALKDLCVIYPSDIYEKMLRAKDEEKGRAVKAMEMLIENARIAEEENIPICQDTGMVIVYLHLGHGMSFDGDINKTINEAVAYSYDRYYLRKSVVDDPLFDRTNTKDNTPCIIYTDFVDSDHLEIEIMAKGFGSENMSAVKMLKPAEGIDGVKDFVIDTVKKAGPNACPPMIVGVGIGGTFEYAAYMAKHSLMKGMDEYHSDERYRKLEEDLLEEINKLDIGPLGLKGKNTCFKVNIESYPTHIAGLPVAVNICCHACRHIKVEVYED
ncbi:MAG: fumarate hydratase [Erysipelotrichaceae bacterium]|nr:fumarate hydratase [Erysipelotrichaceae bacterium]